MFSVLIVAMLAWGSCLFQSAHGQAGSVAAGPESALPSGTPNSWVEGAVRNELVLIQDEKHPIRYMVRKVDRKGDTTREIIESAQGNVARLIQRDGKPISAAEDNAERSRLNGILKSPGDFLKHQEREGVGRTYAIQLIKLLPEAGLYTYTPGQPQPAGATSPQVVIDFRPNPAFHPPTLVSEILTGLKGRVWIDARTGTMSRIEGDLLRPVNFGWGLVARVYPGGHIEFEQTHIEGKRWAYSYIDINVKVREVMLHTVNNKTRVNAWDFQVLPSPLSYEDAVHALLARQIPLQ